MSDLSGEWRTTLDLALALTKPVLQQFLTENGLPKSGTKRDIRARIAAAFESGETSPDAVLDWVERQAPWDKQHVYLLEGPRSSTSRWRDESKFRAHLHAKNVEQYLDARLPVPLPPSLALAKITHDRHRLTMTAAEHRRWLERAEQYDREEETPDGERVILRAHVERSELGLVRFEWDFERNIAMMQIGQLASQSKYEEVFEQFAAIVEPWFPPIHEFIRRPLVKVIKKLQAAEERGRAETRSHSIDYEIDGRRIDTSSITDLDPLIGSQIVNRTLRDGREHGVPRHGNFFWLPAAKSPRRDNPLDDEVHVMILGDEGRINFRTATPEPSVRYVLRRIWVLSR